MADFQLVNKSTIEKWSNDYTLEYIRESALLPYMGSSETSIIRVRNELLNSAGAVIHFPLIARLRGTGVSGGTVLYGSEEALVNYSDSIRTKLVRNAVMITEDQSFKTEIDLYNAGRASLKNWSAEQLRNDVLDQLAGIIVAGATESDGTVGEDSSLTMAAASATQRNAHMLKNTDRILVGGLNVNKASNVQATALALINNTAGVGKLSASVLRTAKSLAKKAGTATGIPHIQPFKSDMTAGREFYVLFVSSEGFRDLSLDTAIVAANTNARSREGSGMDNNPLFQDGDLIYQGIIIREFPELTPALTGGTGAGAASIDVCQAFLCGQSAVAVGYSKKPNPRSQSFDYGHRSGVGISEIRGQKKVSFNGVQYGVFTIWHANVLDG